MATRYGFKYLEQESLLEIHPSSFNFKTAQIQVILFEIDCAIFYTDLHELFCQFISWTKLANSGKFRDNCWISCQVMADMKKVYNDLIIINLYIPSVMGHWDNYTYKVSCRCPWCTIMTFLSKIWRPVRPLK